MQQRMPSLPNINPFYAHDTLHIRNLDVYRITCYEIDADVFITKGTYKGNINIEAPGTAYEIEAIPVLSATALGNGVVSSKLTSVGTLTSLAVLGTIETDGDVFADGIMSAGSYINSGDELRVKGNPCVSVADTFDGTGGLSVKLGGGVYCKNLNNYVGIGASKHNPQYPLHVDGAIDTNSSYKINGVDKLTETGLGATVTSSGLTSVGTLDSLTVNGAINVTGSSNSTFNTNTLYIDATNNKVGVRTLTPAYELDVVGACRATSVRTGGVTITSGTINIPTGKAYQINGADILTATQLASSVTSAPGLTGIGTLSNLTVTNNITSDTIKDSFGRGFLQVLSGNYIDSSTFIPPVMWFHDNADRQLNGGTGSFQNLFVENPTLTGSTVYSVEAFVPMSNDSRTTNTSAISQWFAVRSSNGATFSVALDIRACRATSTADYDQWSLTWSTLYYGTETSFGSVGCNIIPTASGTSGDFVPQLLQIKGSIRVATGGTVNLQWRLDNSTSGIYYTVLKGAWVKYIPMGSTAADVKSGTWS